MAETEAPEMVMESEKDDSSKQDMALEPPTAADGEPNSKRAREEGDDSEEKNDVAKKPKVEAPVTVGPKTFGSSVEMFDYFYKLLHFWTPNHNVNKYEHMMLLDLLKKGHLEAERKIGKGINAFQIRFHPEFKSRCFFLIRDDKSVDDFSFRKCVDHILPLPENMKKSNANNGGGYKGGGRGGGRGRGRGRWGKSRN